MATPKNGRNTENVVRGGLRRLGDYKKPIVVEEQRSSIDAVKRLMKAASKAGGGGGGAPEFIASCPTDPDFVLAIECKADPRDHASGSTDEPFGRPAAGESQEQSAKRVERFGVDGALHYAAHLSKGFNVLAVAVGGETAGAEVVSPYLHVKNAARHKPLQTSAGADVAALIPWADYVEHATFAPTVQRLRSDELTAFSRERHDFMRDHAKLTEGEKPLMVSGTLIALRSSAFAKSYDARTPAERQDEWLRVISQEIHKADIPKAKEDKMVQPYSAIAAHPALGVSTKHYPRGVLYELIRRLNEKVWPLISVSHDFDVVGQFLKYTGGGKKALGIVLTPRHVTELFALLANATKTSRVLDTCAGTGGFLISAMHQMTKTATTSADRERIRKTGRVGVEQQPHMFALAASNMILRGDGKANLYQGSCFVPETVGAMTAHRCTVGLLNPPFSQSDRDLHELAIIRHMPGCLKKGGIGIALAPLSCAISPHPIRHELLRHHALEAVMPMPPDLFYPVGTVACAMAFTAKVPHETSAKKTWFGYWKDDGFVKPKHRGRIDLYGRWPAIRGQWVAGFRNREAQAGLSVTRSATADDGWCAEADMGTDYSAVTREEFEKVVRDYAIFKMLGGPAVKEAKDGAAGRLVRRAVRALPRTESARPHVPRERNPVRVAENGGQWDRRLRPSSAGGDS